MHKKNAKHRIDELSVKTLNVKKIKVAIGKDKKPVDKPNELIFHIDF